MPSAATPIAATAAGRGLASAALPRSSGSTDVMMDVGDRQPPQAHASDWPSPQHLRPAWFSVRDVVMTELIAVNRDQEAGIRYQDELMLLDPRSLPSDS